MKKVLLLGITLFILLSVQAQRVYFVYIQSENKTPFFVKMGDKINSSSAEGYLILSKLVDSTYTFTVGRAGNAVNEAIFTLALNGKDKGFLLRQEEGTLSLFDLQAMTTLKAKAAIVNNSTSGIKRTDKFTVLLSLAANDPSLLDMPAVTTAARVTTETESPKPMATSAVVVSTTVKDADTKTVAEATTPPAQTDTVAVAAAKPEVSPEPKADTVQQATEPVTQAQPEPIAEKKEAVTEASDAVYKRSVVTRRSESSTSAGFGLVYLDEADGVIDTISILIPNPKMKYVTEAPAEEVNTSVTTNDTAVALSMEKVKSATPVVKRTCTFAASDNDFRKLRKYMAAKNDDEDMITEAKKYFKSRCFTTEQIRNLSTLFLTAGGKYSFFDVAYSHVTDAEAFGSLQSELKEEYYINRFKALVGK